MNDKGPGDRPAKVAVVIGATSKWQSDGGNTLLRHGKPLDDESLSLDVRWGVGGAIAQKFAREGYTVVLTTRNAPNAARLASAIEGAGGRCVVKELDLTSEASIIETFSAIRRDIGTPDALIYNAGYMEGRDLPRDQELIEHFPVEMFDRAMHVSSRGPFLVAKAVLPGMRERGSGSFFFSNNSNCLRGRKRNTGESLYYPRVMQRALAQVLTEEYSSYGIHVANVIIDGPIDAPGMRSVKEYSDRPEILINPASIADAFYYLHSQDRSCWTHELQVTPSCLSPSV